LGEALRRCGAERTGTNRRLYSDEQIERLSLLRDITQGGHSIGHVANLPTEKLRQLAKESHDTNGQAARSRTAAQQCLRLAHSSMNASPQ